MDNTLDSVAEAERIITFLSRIAHSVVEANPRPLPLQLAEFPELQQIDHAMLLGMMAIIWPTHLDKMHLRTECPQAQVPNVQVQQHQKNT